MANTPNLALPYILAAQSQKHVTHNEAIRSLDALLQLLVLDKDQATPPGSPAEGARYIVAASPTGAWAGQAGKIAAWQDGAWLFYTPKEGFLAWVADEDRLYRHDGAAWTDLLQNVAFLGINATADSTNRLALAAAASLFNHAGNGHQIKLNKNAPADTASFLFQTGFSGRAEIGTTGDDDFHFKVSADGSTYKEGLRIDKATGIVTFPSGSSTVAVDLFAANGTWTKRPGAKAVQVEVCGAGGGAGGGARTLAATASSGGAAGGGASWLSAWFNAADLGATEAISVGAAGIGGAGATANGANGANGTAGGESSFGSLLAAFPGGGGAGGRVNGHSGGGSGAGILSNVVNTGSGATGGAGFLPDGRASGSSNAAGEHNTFSKGGGGGGAGGGNGTAGYPGGTSTGGGAGGGGSGGGIAAAPVSLAGGESGRAIGSIPIPSSNGGVPASPGATPAATTFGPCAGGSGGGSNAAGNGGNGGNGVRGGGGGGGGSAVAGNGGAGGNGGSGYVRLTTYF